MIVVAAFLDRAKRHWILPAADDVAASRFALMQLTADEAQNLLSIETRSKR